jgi:glycosyltransferase involved in cell wall biosynthesis
MKVLFIARATLYTSPGGDTKQLDLTAEALRSLGVQVDVALADTSPDYAGYDLLHFFNIIRPADIIYHARKSGKPFAVSTIFLDYGAFEKKTRGGVMGLLNRFLSEDGIEYVKAVARWAVNGERVRSAEYLRWGHRRSVSWVARNARVLLPNSENEYRRFVQKYGIQRPYRVVPNGIAADVATRPLTKLPEYEGAVLCVARVEGRKNQLNLIRALNDSPFKLFIHGKPSPNNTAYYEACKREAASNVRFTDWLTEEELYAMYASAKVHVLPSYFETTGLSSLEAAVMGCNIVVTDRGDVRDYFGGHAWFCDPDDPSSIRKAVEEAHAAPYDKSFRDYILTHYTWRRAGEETLTAYETAMRDR